MSIFSNNGSNRNPLTHAIQTSLGNQQAIEKAEQDKLKEEEAIAENMLLSSMGDEQILSAVTAKADQDCRALAASIVLAWAATDTNNFDELEALVAGAVTNADDNDDDESEIDPDKLTDDDLADFNELLECVGSALIAFSQLDAKKVQTFIDDEGDDVLAADIIKAIAESIKGESTDELIADFSVKEALILSAMKKVIRNGEVTYIKKRTRKRKMSSKQRAALKKARRKSHGAAARAKRKKSNRVRSRTGM